MMTQKITVTWWDGSTTTGATWAEVERALRAAQWVEYPSRLDFRLDMRHRAKVWNGVRPSIERASSEDFLRALEASSMCRIDVEQINNDHDSNDHEEAGDE